MPEVLPFLSGFFMAGKSRFPVIGRYPSPAVDRRFPNRPLWRGGSLGDRSRVATKIKLRDSADTRSDYCEDFANWLMITRDPVQLVGTRTRLRPYR